MGNPPIEWFRVYLSERTQCMFDEGVKSDFLHISRGVPQGSIWPLCFSLYFIKNLGSQLPNVKLNPHADDTIIYTTASSMSHVVNELQCAFHQFPFSLHQLKYVLNAKRSNCYHLQRLFTKCITGGYSNSGRSGN